MLLEFGELSTQLNCGASRREFLPSAVVLGDKECAAPGAGLDTWIFAPLAIRVHGSFRS